MAALCRLAVASFLCGGGLYLFVRAVAFWRKLLGALLAVEYWRRSSFLESIRLFKIFKGILECLVTVAVSIIWILFLYAAADGIPRLFSFILAGGGAYLLHVALGKWFLRVESRAIALLLRLFSWISYPFCFLIFKVASGCRSFFSFFLMRFIKFAKGNYTKYTASRYAKKAPRDWGSGKALGWRFTTYSRTVGD